MIDGRFDEGLIVAFAPQAQDVQVASDDRWALVSALTGLATVAALLCAALLAG